MTPVRNDPCPCGSGKKYKQCCLQGAQVISLQAARESHVHRGLLELMLKYVSAVKTRPDVDDALMVYTGSPDEVEDLEESDVDSALDWIIFTHRGPDDETLCDKYIGGNTRLSEAERETLEAWSGRAPAFYTVAALDDREVRLNRLPDQQSFTVAAMDTGLNEGDLITGTLLPVGSGFRFGLSRSRLDPETVGPLVHLLGVEMELVRRQQPGATWDDLFAHFWPRLVDCATLAVVLGERVRSIEAPAGPSVLDEGRHPDSKWKPVVGLLEQAMNEDGFDPPGIRGACRLWRDLALTRRPGHTRPEGWAGGLFYLVQTHIYGDDLTQEEAGGIFGVSAASVGKRAREVADALGVRPLDLRYVDLLDPLVRGLWRLDCMRAAEGAAVTLSGHGLDLTRHATEAVLRQASAPAEGRIREAEELIDQAWEATGPRRIKLARQALSLWPDAADAYVILAGDAADRGQWQEAARRYGEGVVAGARALGPDPFTEDVGHFWGLLETRPYMRARAGLAGALWELGDREGAVGHYQELLRLNEGDNQGIRYILASCFVHMQDDDRLGRLLAANADDGTAAMMYTRALWHFRQGGPGLRADRTLRDAIRLNPHVPAFLLGTRALPRESPPYIGCGDETEAGAYALEYGLGWQQAPGALDWLRNLEANHNKKRG